MLKRSWKYESLVKICGREASYLSPAGSASYQLHCESGCVSAVEGRFTVREGFTVREVFGSAAYIHRKAAQALCQTQHSLVLYFTLGQIERICIPALGPKGPSGAGRYHGGGQI